MAPAPITTNVRHPFTGQLCCTVVFCITICLLKPSNTRSRQSASIQDSTKEYNIYNKYKLSILQLTTSSTIWNLRPYAHFASISSVSNKDGTLFPTVYSVCAAVTTSKCLHNSPVSYDQRKNKTQIISCFHRDNNSRSTVSSQGIEGLKDKGDKAMENLWKSWKSSAKYHRLCKRFWLRFDTHESSQFSPFRGHRG